MLKNGKALADIKGRKINIVELSVSHYLLARALATVKLRERDIKIINTSDADIVGAFKSPDSTAVVTSLEESEEEWAGVANIIHSLFLDGYRLGGDMNVSWNGRCDAYGDPEPDNNYLPCRKPVAVFLDGRRLCARHDYTDYKAKSEAAIQCSGTVDEL